MQNSEHTAVTYDQAGVRRLFRRRLVIVIAAVAVLVAAIVGFNVFKAHMIAQVMAKNASPTQTVATATVRFSDWQPQLQAVGSLRAVRGVDITTEVAGLVRSVEFHSGEDAHGGQLLVQLNADSDVAQLRALQAAADLAAVVYKRDQMQFDAQAISQAQLDSDAADLKNKRAQAAAQAATVAKKALRAPFPGRLGITTVNPGQYLNPGDKVVTLQQLDPILVDFRLPQQELARVAPGQSVTLTTDAYPGQTFSGHITAVNPLVDAATRNVQIEAAVGNAARRLVPGMFARIAAAAGQRVRYLTMPQTAVTYNPYGSTVFVVEKSADGSRNVKQTFVTLGSTRGDQVAVTGGLTDGDVVVTAGQMKLKNGTPVTIDNSVKPTDDPNPSPQEE